MNELEWQRKKLKFNKKINDKFHNKNTTEKEKILLVLEYADWQIHPYSLSGKLGYKKYIRKAIKLLKEVLGE